MAVPARIALVALALLAGAAPVPAAAAGSDVVTPPVPQVGGGRVDPRLVERIRELLRPPAQGTAPVQEELAAQLAALGSGATATLFAFLTGAALESVGEVPAEIGWAAAQTDAPGWTSREDKIILEALTALPTPAVLGELERNALGDAPMQVRLVAMRVLERLGSADGLALWFDVLAEIEPIHEMRPYVSTPFEKALERMLLQDGRTFRELEPRLRHRDATELAIVARALGRAHRDEGLELFEPMLGRSTELDVLVLEQAAEIARTSNSGRIDEALVWLRPLLDAPDDATRGQAVRTLSELEDTVSVPDIIVRLEDQNRRVRVAARSGLERISGLKLGDEPGPWKLWFANQLRWLETEGARLTDQLDSSDMAEVVRALGALSQRRLFRDELVGPLTRVLQRPENEAVSAACAALAQLGSRRAVEPLLEVLRDPEERVRGSACNALRKLTGRDLPPDYDAWVGRFLRG
jgi:HEAT repeat protein